MITGEFLSWSNDQWKHIIKTQELSLQELNCYIPHIPESCYLSLIKHQNLTAQFILDFFWMFSYIYQIKIIKHQRIHQETIAANLELFEPLMWHVCRYQYLTEDFLLQHANIIDWKQIFLNHDHYSILFIIRSFKQYFPRDEYIYNASDVFHKHLMLHKENRAAIKNLIDKHNNRIRTVATAARSASRS